MDSWPFLEEEPNSRTVHRPPERRRLRHRPHRFRHHRFRAPVRAVHRVARRRRRRERINGVLRGLSVPVLAVTPASLWYIDPPVNIAIAVPLGVVGLVLMFGPRA